MARELTPQEQQALADIREQKAAAVRELNDALRIRRELEFELAQTQRQMVSSDGVTSSLESVDAVSRLRRDIQTAAVREQNTDEILRRLSAREMQLLSLSSAGRGTTAPAPRAQTTTRAPSAGAAGVLQSGLGSLRLAQSRYERSSAARTTLEQQLMRDIKKSAVFVFIGALCVAALADILSIFDVGWLVSWAIPMIVWFLVRRITAINSGAARISAAQTVAQRQLTLLQQRLRPAVLSSGNASLLTAPRPAVSVVARSYVGTFVRDTVITQVFELIPVLDWLPMYMGQVVKVLINQNTAYKKARALMPELSLVHRQIDLLEQFEIEFMAQQIATVVRARQLIGVRRSQSPSAPIQQAGTPVPLSLSYAT